MDDFIIQEGGKKEFMDMTDASAKSDQWMHSYNDYECYKKMLGDENMRFLAAKTKSGEYVGSCMCFIFPEHAFVAAYYVRPEFRSQGLGSRLFGLVVNDEVRKKNIGLHSAPAMAATYEAKLGFTVKVPWIVYKCKIKNINFAKLSCSSNNIIVKDIKAVSLEQLVVYDTKVARTNRKSFVQSWIYERPDLVSKVALNSKNEIIGYGSALLYSIWDSPAFCPVYSDNDHVFKAIFASLVSHFEEHIKRENLVDMRVPTGKLETIRKILEGIADIEAKIGNTPLFTKSVPDHDIDKIYSVADLNMFI